MSGLSSPPNGRPGRKPMPRAIRESLGLPTCANPECDRSPTKRDHCRPHYDLLLKRRRGDLGPDSRFLRHTVSAEMADAVRRAAAGDKVTQAEWIRQAITRALAVMVATPP